MTEERGKKRDRAAIRLRILEICQEEGGANLTKIVYGANLNFKTVYSYLDELASNGMIMAAGPAGKWRYATTRKGIAAAASARASELV